MARFTLSLFFLLVICTAKAQLLTDSVFVLPDTARPFTIENFYQIIIRDHPVARQASLLSEMGKQEIRLARGNFDPKLESQFLLKHYNNTEYYRLFDGSIKIPTRSPLTPSIGVERNTGSFVNPENYISEQYNYQQMYAGISIPLGQGLITDERRTTLRQAEVFADMLEADQVKMINKLLLDAAKDYWQWYFSYYNFRLAANNARIAEEIFKMTKTSFDGGEAARIDTIQSRINFLERCVTRQEAFTEWRNSTVKISAYLWDSLMNPVELSPQYVPVNETELIVLSGTSLEELVSQAKANHPDLMKLNLKIEQLGYERKLAAEFLKPQLNLSLYKINQPFNPEGVAGSFNFNDDYKLGLDFAFPLFLRKERAKLSQTRLKLRSTAYERDLATRQVINDINIAYNQLLNNGVVLQQQREMVDNYYKLMNAELVNLRNGESDLFKISVQQEKLFNAESKLIKTITEYEKQKALLYWSAGVRPLR